MSLDDVLGRHRGPFRFLLTTKDEKGLHSLSYPLDPEETIATGDVYTQAKDVMETDPNVLDVGVWSLTDEQFVTVIRRRDVFPPAVG